MNTVKLLTPFAVGLLIWLAGHPADLSPDAWQLFAIFVGTIVGVILKPLPMPAVALTALFVTSITRTVPFSEALKGFSHEVVWLIVFAYFVAIGFIKSGLGTRISTFFLMLLGKRSLGLAYGLACTETILAPAIPSASARAGGVVYPLVESLSLTYDSKPNHPSRSRIGTFLAMVAFQCNTVTDAMFLTAMAANPLAARLAEPYGFSLTWGTWALAASLPGILSLILVPLLIYFLYPPEVKETPLAKEFAQKRLEDLGPMKQKEWLMLGIFSILILLWVFGSFFGLSATLVALMGLVFLFLFKVIEWKDALREEGAWTTLIWFSILLMMATELNNLGFTSWFGSWITTQLTGLHVGVAVTLTFLIYFYSHYFFASNTAHVGALFAPFLAVATSLGAPAALSALLLAFYSNLFGGLTPYGSGPAAIYYGSGYVPLRSFWVLGFLCSVLNLAIWSLVGALWWNILGLW